MNILLIDNEFDGAYGSIHVFLHEIYECLNRMGHKVYVSRHIKESLDLIKNNRIAFSIGIGRFNQYISGIPLYEYARVLHYQWVIDNPYKLEIDTKSSFIKYILIDRKFRFCMDAAIHEPLFLPLGVSGRNSSHVERTQRKPGIVFSGQVRDVNGIYGEIKHSRLKKEVEMFIEEAVASLDKPFIDLFNETVKEVSPAGRKEVFRLCNSYIRAYKRKHVLSAISNYPVYLLGDIRDEDLKEQNNIYSVGKRSYEEAFYEMQKYEFSINIEPNFNDGMHDRVLRSIWNECILITNDGELQEKVLKDYVIYYKYKDVDQIQTIISESADGLYSKKAYMAKQIVMDHYTWFVIMNQLTDDYRREAYV